MTVSARCLLAGLVVIAIAGTSASAESIRRDRSPSWCHSRPAAPPISCTLIGQHLEQRLGRPFVVENRPGAGSVTAAVAVARSPPDGYTLLMAPSVTMAINVSLHKALPYNPATDFVPLALLVATPLCW